ncbi:MAG: redoxin family protein [Moraxella osloensis]
MITQAQLPKQPFLLNVWASWCVTCKVEHPFLLQMSKAGVPIVGVNYKDETKDALDYLNTHEDPFTLNVQDKRILALIWV